MILSAFAALVTPAHASQMALDPQNRVHVGFSYIDDGGLPGGIGLTAGFDSRLTRIIAIDIGGFVSPLESGVTVDPEAPYLEHVLLRHGLNTTLGVRVPHAQPKDWAWEFFLRGGGGVVWLETLPYEVGSTLSDDTLMFDIAGTGGADLLVRFGHFGVRATGRAWVFDVVEPSPMENLLTVRPQGTLEALIQW